jgi:rhodanese-related sulfurtransferase
MSKNQNKTTYLIILPLLILLASPVLSAADNVSTVTKEELKAQLDSSDIIILDVRTGKDWKSSEFKIKGAIRANPGEFDNWAETYPKDMKLILYCAWPNEGTSAGLARKLMANGYTDVHALKGGWREWFRAEFPVEEK